jgi:cysteine-rich repeat protein
MKTIIALSLFLLSVTSVFAAGNVKLYTGLEFSNNSVQQKAAVLPICSSGEVYVNSGGAMTCGTVMPIEKGIATCVSGNCSVSACMSGFGDCDHDFSTGCEVAIGTIQNCSCGVNCTPTNQCIASACSNGACLFTNVDAGTLTSFNVIGNCKKSSCDGNGSIVISVDDTNMPNDGNECTTAHCTNGTPSNIPVSDGVPCTGGACNAGQCRVFACGNGIIELGEQCDDGNVTNGDGCSSTCTSEASCGDGVKNGTETDIDCGGVCAPCASSKQCTINSDCSSQFCLNGMCQ